MVPLCGVSLYRLHVPNAFGRRLDLTWMQSGVFPQGVPAAITLMRRCMEMEWVELELGVR